MHFPLWCGGSSEPRWFDPFSQKEAIKAGKRLRNKGGVLMAPASLQFICWNRETEQFGLMIATGRRDCDNTSFVCALNRRTICKLWLESWILMLLCLRRVNPGTLSECWDFSSGNNQDRDDGGPKPWTGAVQSSINHLHSLPVSLKLQTTVSQWLGIPRAEHHRRLQTWTLSASRTQSLKCLITKCETCTDWERAVRVTPHGRDAERLLSYSITKL